jgi:hypothetical protein
MPETGWRRRRLRSRLWSLGDILICPTFTGMCYDPISLSASDSQDSNYIIPRTCVRDGSSDVFLRPVINTGVRKTPGFMTAYIVPPALPALTALSHTCSDLQESVGSYEGSRKPGSHSSVSQPPPSLNHHQSFFSLVNTPIDTEAGDKPVDPVTIKFNQAASLYPAVAICCFTTGKLFV